MKRFLNLLIIVMLVASSVFLLSACDNSGNDYSSNDYSLFNYKTDFQYYYNSVSGSNAPITKSETGYYFFLPNRFLYYLDKESMEATPLCNKVNCLHNNRDECDAFFNLLSTPSTNLNMSNIIQCYEDNLYMVIREEDEYGNFAGNSLYKVSLDGVTREKLVSFESVVPYWLIHRGYFYYVQDKYSDNVESIVVYDSYSINRLPLDNLNEQSVEVFNSKNLCNNVTGSYQFTAYGDYILTTTRPMSEDDVENYISTGKRTVSEIELIYSSTNINTLETYQITNEEGNISSPVFYDGKLLYFIGNGDSASKVRYYTSNLDGSNPTFFREMEYGDNLFSNGEQIYLYNVITAFEQGADYDEVKMLDLKFDVISTFRLPFKYSFGNIPQDPEYFIFIQQLENSETEVYSVDKSKLDNMDGEEVEYNTVYSSLDDLSVIKNSVAKTISDDILQTDDAELKNMFEKAQELCYQVSSKYDDSLSDKISDGFSITMHWSGDGGNYTANFQILKFYSDTDVSNFVKENPFSLVNGNYVAFVSVDTVPIEIKDMLDSIISNEPITPIEIDEFSGDMYSFI